MISKVLLISVVPTIALIAYFAARERTPRRGLRVAIYALVVFHAFYLFALLYVLPRLGL
jgi:uncharacterized membrane protein (GlpM family)